MRGLAALVVVVHHGCLTSSALAKAYVSNGKADGWPFAFTFTPLHIIWGGKEAVFVFFVLSGLVLTLPRLRPRPESWTAYYPKRLARLYLPVIGAVFVSMAIVAVVGRRTGLDNWWMNAHSLPNVRDFLSDVTLLARTGKVNTALWSLKSEVWFSLLLPLYVFLGLAVRRLGFVVAFAGIVLTVIVGLHTKFPWLVFMPVFGVGVLIAFHLKRFESLSRKYLAKPAGVVTAVLLAVLALTAEWWTLGLGFGRSVADVTQAVGVLSGAGLLVVLALFATPVAAALELSWIKWLGIRSFSLYLIHEPIVVSVATLLPADSSTLLIIMLSVVISLLAAEAFYRVVELPAHRLSRRIGASAPGWFARIRHR